MSKDLSARGQIQIAGDGTNVESAPQRVSVFRFVAFGFLLAVMAGALLVPGLTRGSQKVGTVDGLKQQVTAFWEARLKKDHQVIYDIYEPRLHDAASLTDFLRSRGLIDYFVYSIEDVRVDGDHGSSKVRYSWKPNHPAFSSMRPKDDVIEDKWIFVDGVWRKIYEGFSQDQNPLPAGSPAGSVRQVENPSAANAPAAPDEK